MQPRAACVVLVFSVLSAFGGKPEDYGHRWLGFPESDLHRWLASARFKKIELSVVAREEQPPHYATILAGGGTLTA